jgi:hypothetical protein
MPACLQFSRQAVAKMTADTGNDKRLSHFITPQSLRDLFIS